MNFLKSLFLRMALLAVLGLTAAWAVRIYEKWHKRNEYFTDKVLPIVAQNNTRNANAATHAADKIRVRINEYHAGVGPFVEDITSIGTRGKILLYLPGDKLAKKHNVEILIKEKFDKHLFSEAKLKRDLAEVFDSFRLDLQANQNLLLQDVRALTKDNHTESEIGELQDFGETVRQELLRIAKDHGEKSARYGLAALVASGVVGAAAEEIVALIIAETGVAVATTAVAAGGSTAGGATVGTGVGAFGGPVGAGVGCVVGLIVGFGVDWWMTDSFKQKTERELNAQIDRLRETLLNGRENNKGMISLLTHTADHVGEAQRDQLRRIFAPPFFMKGARARFAKL